MRSDFHRPYNSVGETIRNWRAHSSKPVFSRHHIVINKQDDLTCRSGNSGVAGEALTGSRLVRITHCHTKGFRFANYLSRVIARAVINHNEIDLKP
jgi:hypothetical protein